MRKVLILLVVLTLVPRLAFAQFGGSGAGCNGTGTGTATAGQISLNGATSGTISILPQAAAGTYNFNMPTTAGTAGQSLTSQGGSATAMTWGNSELALSAGSGAFGNNTNFPTGTILLQYKALNAGHFTQLSCNNVTLAGGSCTTAPTVNIADNTSAGSATLLCSTTVQNTKGTTTTGAQTLTFAAGDVISVYVSTQGATCTAPIFSVNATISEP